MKKTFGLLAIAMTALWNGAVWAGALELAAHKAFYALEIKNSRSSGFTDVRGVVRVLRERSCDGWISEETVRMAVETDLDRVFEQGLHFTGWESFDGRHYSFASRSRSNAERLESRGSAQRGKIGDTGEVTYRLPSAQKQTLPPDTFFPSNLVTWVIAKTKAGEKRLQAHSFDGTDEEGAELMVIYVGKEEAADATGKGGDHELLAGKAWNVRFAAFALDSSAAEPSYEFEAKLIENGILAEAVLDFNDFTVLQRLVKVEKVEIPQC